MFRIKMLNGQEDYRQHSRYKCHKKNLLSRVKRVAAVVQTGLTTRIVFAGLKSRDKKRKGDSCLLAIVAITPRSLGKNRCNVVRLIVFKPDLQGCRSPVVSVHYGTYTSARVANVVICLSWPRLLRR